VSAAEDAPLGVYPLPDAEGGWRCATTPHEVRDLAGLDPEKLALAAIGQEGNFGGSSWAICVIRHGVLGAELTSYSGSGISRFDVASVTKSFTSLAFGMAFDDPVCSDRLTLEAKIYDFIPDGYPLTDKRKAEITVGQVLSMTAGFAGEDHGAFGAATRLGDGLFEYVIGKAKSRDGVDVGHLIADPGSFWEYSDPGYAHLALVFAEATGQEIDTYLDERLFTQIGVPAVSWSRSGGGELLGPHPLAFSGLVLSARELARCGYLLLRGGLWDGRRIVSQDWIATATVPSQPFNPHYGYGMWVNTTGTLWPPAPADAFAMMGFRGNRCWVFPSLDLVIARVGTGPLVLDDRYIPVQLLKALL
jgi:CubicO group peptidase (beta-lactamase class C family)